MDDARGAGKPLLLTECGALGQKMRRVAPVCRHFDLGWVYAWLMVTGVFTEEAGLFLPDGTARDGDELEAIKQACVL